MARNRMKILAIDPGTKHMGYAFLDKGKLLYYGVKVIEKKRSPHETLEEGRKVVLDLINDLKPNVLVVEKAFVSNNRSASLLNVFFDEIRATGQRKERWLKLLPQSTQSLGFILLRIEDGKSGITRICLMR